MPMKRKISGMEAMDKAEYWLKALDGDRDDAVRFVARHVRGRLRRETIIAAIDLLDERAHKEWEAKFFNRDREDQTHGR